MATETIITDKMVFGGDCIGKRDGKTVFVPYAIPGETLEVEITGTYRDYDTARIVRILNPSIHRVTPFCPLFGICGGCTMQHIDSAWQRKLRASILKDCFTREGITVPEIEIISGEPEGYRCRFQFHNGSLSERNSDRLVPITACPVATPEINQYLASVPVDQRPKGRIHVFGDSRIIPADSTDPFSRVIIAQEEGKKIITEKKIYGSPKRTIKDHTKHRFEGTAATAENRCTVTIAGRNIVFDVRGFFQSNLSVLEKTLDAVCFNMGGKNVLDMYAGAGTFSVFLSDYFEKTTLVEHNRDALVFAEMNLAGKKHDSYGVSGEQWVKNNAASIISSDGQFDAVVIDPPRSGMEPAVSRWLQENKTSQIRSISCDPATQARDAARLIKSGYSLARLYLLDFYPQTAHIESLACFEYFS